MTTFSIEGCSRCPVPELKRQMQLKKDVANNASENARWTSSRREKAMYRGIRDEFMIAWSQALLKVGEMIQQQKDCGACPNSSL